MRPTRILCLAVFLGLGVSSLSSQGVNIASYDSAVVNGLTIAYREVGKGEPLVMLHGFYGTGATWEPLFEDLSQHYRLIVPDLRGHGRSTILDGRFTHRDAARDIYGLLDRLGIERFKAVGFSSGGMTLLHMATSQPQRIDAMVLVGATSYFPEEARRIMRVSSPDSVTPEWMAALEARHVRGREQVLALINQFHGFKDSYDDMNFTPPYLSTIVARTLIVHGDRDRFFPVRIPVEQYKAIPRSYLWIMPNTGHVPFPANDRQLHQYKEILLDFLAATWN